MGNHCVNCEVCKTDLRGSGEDACGWGSCPGWIIGAPETLEKIATEHPSPEIKEKAREQQRKVKEWEAGEPARAEARRLQKEREEACPKHEYRDTGGFMAAILKCIHCEHTTYGL